MTTPKLRGVKCVVRDPEGRVLWVRHTYGDRAAWELPGGAVRRGEPPADGARREFAEELGVDLEVWTPLGETTGHWTGAELTLTCLFSEVGPGVTLDPDPVEIAACQWAGLDAPPGRVGVVTEGSLPVVRSGLADHA